MAEEVLKCIVCKKALPGYRDVFWCDMCGKSTCADDLLRCFSCMGRYCVTCHDSKQHGERECTICHKNICPLGGFTVVEKLPPLRPKGPPHKMWKDYCSVECRDGSNPTTTGTDDYSTTKRDEQ